MIDLYTRVIIVEIDEDQHKSYDTTCEKVRTMELWEDIACRDIVFIRFNPDSYVDGFGVKQSPCFEGHTRNETEIYNRLYMLGWLVEQCINLDLEKSVELFLYYDGFNRDPYNEIPMSDMS